MECIEGITVVTTGSLNGTGSSIRNLVPFVDNLFLFSNKTGTSSSAVLTVTGSSHLWTGHIYAPNGLVEITGSNNTIQGMVLGEWVRLTGSNLTIGASSPLSFPDVLKQSPSYTEIMKLAESGVVSGYGDGTFRPRNTASRGQVTKIVDLAFGWTVDRAIVSQSTYYISDITEEDPYYYYVQVAYAHGIVNGYADGTFKPYNQMTREQLTKVMVKAAGLQAVQPEVAHFNDVPKDSAFFAAT